LLLLLLLLFVRPLALSTSSRTDATKPQGEEAVSPRRTRQHT
jgi:hypothetical protein